MKTTSPADAAAVGVPVPPVFTLVVAILLVAACGRTPTAPVERVCWTDEIKLPILNAAGDTVAFNTFRTRRCTGS